MMDDMMGDIGWGMGLIGLLGILLVPVIAAPLKYVFFR
jgi:hypothetical protein